jgi:hypothetical protein
VKTDKTSKKKASDDLDEMREAFKHHKERAKGGGSSKNDWDKLGDGKNLRRWLPRPGERKFYTEGWTHFNVGPNDRAVRCIDEAHIDPEKSLPMSGTKCPRCRRFLREQARINSEYAKGDADGQEEWKRAKDKYVPRHQFYSNTLREDDEGDFEVKITNYGPQVWGQLMNYYLGDDTDVGDFTHPESGSWMNVKKENKGGRNRRNVEYKVFPVEGPSIEDAWDAIKEQLHDLEAAPGKILSVEEFVAIEKGVDVDKDSDDDADDARSKKRRRKSRDAESDDEDEDEDDDGGEEEDEDDEDERPVKVKKSKLADKMKKRRRDDD